MRQAVRRAQLRSQRALDRARLAWLQWLHPGLRVARDATPAFGTARFNLAPGARLEIAAGAATEHRPGALSFVIHAGGRIVVEEEAWLRTEVGPITLVAFAGGEIRIGARAMLNGCSISAKHRVRLGRRVLVGPGSRIYDSDQHDLDAERLEQGGPVEVGDHSWLAADVTVLKGVEIGEHCVVGTRALVTGDLPAHSFAFGAPARPRGKIGDRSQAR